MDDLERLIQKVETDFEINKIDIVGKEFLESVKLRKKPWRQRIILETLVAPNLAFFPGVNLQFEGLENLPNPPYIVAMNHSDKYNYFPLHLEILRGGQYATAWVKGKNYDHLLMKSFMNFFGGIPIPHTSYFLNKLYQNKGNTKEKMPKVEYEILKNIYDGKTDVRELSASERTGIIGYFIERVPELKRYHQVLMKQVGFLTKKALLEKELVLLIFPEGTRSSKLGEGRNGIAQVVLNTELPVVPIGCNNGDEIYPGNSPFAKKGDLIYRVGEPITVEGKLKPYKIKESFELLGENGRYNDQFNETTNIIMKEINSLLDEKHQNNGLYA